MTLLLEALGSILRWLLAFGAGYLVRHGVWSQGAADGYVTAAATAIAMALVSIGWSLWQKYSARIKLLTALSLPAGSSIEQVQQRVDAGMGAKLGAMLLACALGAVAVTVTGCAGNKAPSGTPAPVLAAVKATEVVHALDAARDVAKVVSDAYPAVISAKDFQTVLTFHTAAVTVIGATPSGWKPTVEAALDQVQKDLSPSAAARLGPYLSLVKALVDGYVPAGS